MLPNSFKWWPWVDRDLFYGTVKWSLILLYGEKAKTMGFLETIVVYDIKVGRWSQLNEYMKVYEYQRSRSFIDLGPSHSDLIFSNFFSSITVRPIEAKFHVEPPWDGRTKIIQMVQVTGPRWPPCPYMIKTFKNLRLWNQMADDLETWYAAFGTWVLQRLLKWWSWVYLDLFYDKFKFGPLCFCMRKS